MDPKVFEDIGFCHTLSIGDRRKESGPLQNISGFKSSKTMGSGRPVKISLSFGIRLINLWLSLSDTIMILMKIKTFSAKQRYFYSFKYLFRVKRIYGSISIFFSFASSIKLNIKVIFHTLHSNLETFIKD